MRFFFECRYPSFNSCLSVPICIYFIGSFLISSYTLPRSLVPCMSLLTWPLIPLQPQARSEHGTDSHAQPQPQDTRLHLTSCKIKKLESHLLYTERTDAHRHRSSRQQYNTSCQTDFCLKANRVSVSDGWHRGTSGVCRELTKPTQSQLDCKHLSLSDTQCAIHGVHTWYYDIVQFNTWCSYMALSHIVQFNTWCSYMVLSPTVQFNTWWQWWIYIACTLMLIPWQIKCLN